MKLYQFALLNGLLTISAGFFLIISIESFLKISWISISRYPIDTGMFFSGFVTCLYGIYLLFRERFSSGRVAKGGKGCVG